MRANSSGNGSPPIHVSNASRHSRSNRSLNATPLSSAPSSCLVMARVTTGVTILRINPLLYLLPVYRYFPRCVHSHSHLMPADFPDRHTDISVDDDSFTNAPG